MQCCAAFAHATAVIFASMDLTNALTVLTVLLLFTMLHGDLQNQTITVIHHD